MKAAAEQRERERAAWEAKVKAEAEQRARERAEREEKGRAEAEQRERERAEREAVLKAEKEERLRAEVEKRDRERAEREEMLKVEAMVSFGVPMGNFPQSETHPRKHTLTYAHIHGRPLEVDPLTQRHPPPNWQNS